MITLIQGNREIQIDPNDPEQMAALNTAIDASCNWYDEEAERIAKEHGISLPAACDVLYLRTRSRHTEALEQKLIDLHKAGKAPNIYEFGHESV